MHKIVPMPTAAEKKALVFVSVVALLGVTVRIWRLQHPQSQTGTHSVSSDQTDPHHSGQKNPKYQPKNARSKTPQRRDSTSVVDLDRATLRDIEALGVLKPGVARLIVVDRDSFGPFGSLHELERIPYLERSDFRALAPRVTFSMLPRPKNAVMRPYADPATSEPVHRRRRIVKDVPRELH